MAFVCLQAKKNVVSGKVFEAHEEALKHQRSIESKEQQLQQLQANLQQERRQRCQLQSELEQRSQEVERLRHQLEEARAGGTVAAAPAAAVAGTKPPRAQLQLPIQQMLAAQQAQAEAAAEAEAAAAEAAADAPEPAAERSRETSCSGTTLSIRTSVAGRAAAGAVLEFTGSPAHGRPQIQGKVDRTPTRDQDMLAPLAVGGKCVTVKSCRVRA